MTSCPDLELQKAPRAFFHQMLINPTVRQRDPAGVSSSCFFPACSACQSTRPCSVYSKVGQASSSQQKARTILFVVPPPLFPFYLEDDQFNETSLSQQRETPSPSTHHFQNTFSFLQPTRWPVISNRRNFSALKSRLFERESWPECLIRYPKLRSGLAAKTCTRL